MLIAFRRFGQTSIVKYGLLLLALSFISWGIGDYLNGGGNTTAVRVGDGEISVNELYQSYQQRKSQFSQITGQEISDETAAQMGLPNLIISEQVRQKLLENNATRLGFVGSDQEVARTIQSMSAFQQDDAFNADIYRQNLQLSGTTASAFETSMKQQQQQNTLRSLFRPQATQNWVKAQAQTDNSLLDIAIWPITAKSLSRLPAPTEAELNDFYAARTAQYQTPETRDVTLLSIAPENFTPKTQPTTTEIEAYYADNAHLFSLPETRTIQQVISADKTSAEAVRAQLIAGESLPNAVELGTLTAQELPAAFASEVFALDANAYSQPLETPFGYAIAWATDIQASAQKSLTDVRPEIIALLQEESALNAFEDALENIDDAAAGGTPLTQIAAEFNLTPTSLSTLKFDTEALSANSLATAFELSTNEVSTPIEEENGDFTFIEVTNITPPTLPALNTQFDRILADFTATRTQERINAAIQKVRQELNAGQPLPQALKAAQLNTRPIALNKQKKEDLTTLGWPSNTFNQLLSLSAQGILAQNVIYQDNTALLQLKNRTIGNITPEALTTAQTTLNNHLRDELFVSYLHTQEAQQKIKLNENRLRQVFSSGENGAYN